MAGDQLTGTVVAFDAARGLGEIRPDVAPDDRDAVVPFHCIEIADGTRDIAVGAHVTYVVLPKFGRYEAAAIRPADGD